MEKRNVKLGLFYSAMLFVVSCSASNADAPPDTQCAQGGASCVSAFPPGGGGQVGGQDSFPCDVQTLLTGHCWTCHGTEPKYGAPSLVTTAAFRAMSHKDPSKTVGQLAAIRVQDPTQRMPPAGNPVLSDSDIAVLQGWASRGNPAGPACAAPPLSTGGTGTVGGGGVSSVGAGGAGVVGAGGTTYVGVGGVGPVGAGGIGGAGPVGAGGTGAGDLPADAVCYQIRARNDASNAPFTVPTTPDYYAAFLYSPPWGTKKVQIVRARSLIDNDKVIHHWLLYNNTGTVADGTNSQSIGAHPDAVLIVGWAPGNEPPTLPADVGLGVPGQGFTLEVHYNNKLGSGQTDKSGVEICVTQTLRAHEAQVSWLGTQSLNKTTASGTCKPNLSGPVNVLFSWPHEHLQGRHLKTVINRASGTTEVLIDQPFDFNSQIAYPTPAVINPGDSLTTTCTYAQPTPFGQGTTSEMCYNFVTAYPGGALSNGPSLFRINDCTN